MREETTNRIPKLRLFAFATLFPAGLLAVGCLFGGAWPGLGLAAMTIVVYAMDRITLKQPHSDDDGRALCWVIAGTHFILLGLGVAALSGGQLSGFNLYVLWLGLGLWFGQVGNSTAHEMIHRPDRITRRAGAAMFAALLYGHHTSAHLKVHHVYAATDHDPNSARKGEGFYAFVVRAVSGEFIAGLRAENRLRAVKATGVHPYAGYLAMSVLCVIGAALIGGFGGVVALLTLAAYAQIQLLLSDYVQHYGLRRAAKGNGFEPVGPQHSWNAAQVYSGAMMLNAPHHSEHHATPAKPFPDLEISQETMPILPRSLPVMATVALVPPLWRRIMDSRVTAWQAKTGVSLP